MSNAAMSSQSNPSNRAPSSAASRFRPWRTLALTALTAAILAIILLVSVLLFGRIDGEEFAPEQFQRRTFHYFEVPLLRLQVWPIHRTQSTNPLEAWLSNNAFVGSTQGKGGSPGQANSPASAPSGGDAAGSVDPASAKPAGDAEKPGDEQEPADSQEPGEGEKPGDDDVRWDLVVARRSGQITAVGDARILCRYLDARTATGELYWLAWTRNHQPLGKVAWSAVGKLARQQMYIFVPEVLEQARTATDPARLERRIGRLLADRFLELAVSQQKLQRHGVALELIEDGLSYDPDNARLLAARRESRDAIERDGEQ